MPRRLSWLVVGIVLVAAAIFLFKNSPPHESYTSLMNRGNGFLEKSDATNAIAAYTEAIRARAGGR